MNYLSYNSILEVDQNDLVGKIILAGTSFEGVPLDTKIHFEVDKFPVGDRASQTRVDDFNTGLDIHIDLSEGGYSQQIEIWRKPLSELDFDHTYLINMLRLADTIDDQIIHPIKNNHVSNFFTVDQEVTSLALDTYIFNSVSGNRNDCDTIKLMFTVNSEFLPDSLVFDYDLDFLVLDKDGNLVNTINNIGNIAFNKNGVQPLTYFEKDFELPNYPDHYGVVRINSYTLKKAAGLPIKNTTFNESTVNFGLIEPNTVAAPKVDKQIYWDLIWEFTGSAQNQYPYITVNAYRNFIQAGGCSLEVTYDAYEYDKNGINLGLLGNYTTYLTFFFDDTNMYDKVFAGNPIGELKPDHYYALSNVQAVATPLQDTDMTGITINKTIHSNKMIYNYQGITPYMLGYSHKPTLKDDHILVKTYLFINNPKETVSLPYTVSFKGKLHVSLYNPSTGDSKTIEYNNLSATAYRQEKKDGLVRYYLPLDKAFDISQFEDIGNYVITTYVHIDYFTVDSIDYQSVARETIISATAGNYYPVIGGSDTLLQLEDMTLTQEQITDLFIDRFEDRKVKLFTEAFNGTLKDFKAVLGRQEARKNKFLILTAKLSGKVLEDSTIKFIDDGFNVAEFSESNVFGFTPITNLFIDDIETGGNDNLVIQAAFVYAHTTDQYCGIGQGV